MPRTLLPFTAATLTLLLAGCFDQAQRRTDAAAIEVRCDSSACVVCDAYGCEPLSCASPGGCPSGTSCRRGFCAPPEAGGAGCLEHADCDQTQVCAAGRCVDPSMAERSACDAGHPCGLGLVCAEGVCAGAPASPELPLRPEGLCQYDQDCPSGAACLDGACRSACGAGSSCAPTLSCRGGLCLPAESSEGSCAVGSDCGFAAVCKNGACIPVCSGDVDCGAGTRCVESLCLPDTRPVIQCLHDADCTGGTACLDGRCLPPCTSGDEAACPAEARCVFGFCLRDPECTFI